MTEIGETVVRVDTLIRETKMFQTMCNSEIERAEEVVATGNNICMVSVVNEMIKAGRLQSYFLLFTNHR